MITRCSFIISLIVIHFSASYPFNITTLLPAVRKNFFGSCRISVTNEMDDIMDLPKLHKNDRFLLFPQFPSDEELKVYRRILPTVSRVNEKLSLGIIRGIPQATSWATRQDQAWQLDESHPRSNKSNCVRVTQLSYSHPLVIYEQYKINHPFYLIYHQNVLVHEMGMVASNCGYFQPLESCELRFKFVGRKWYNSCVKGLMDSKKFTWKEITSSESILLTTNHSYCRVVNTTLAALQSPKKKRNKHKKATIPTPTTTTRHLSTTHNETTTLLDKTMRTFWRYESTPLFLIDCIWDYNYHHFLIDSFVRVIRSLDFLTRNPHIKIHIRAFEVHKPSEKTNYHIAGPALRRNVFALVGLDPNRIVYGNIIAKEVYITKNIPCNYPINNALELRLLRKVLIDGAERMQDSNEVSNLSPMIVQFAPLDPPIEPIPYPKKIVLQIRECFDETNSDCRNNWRGWFLPEYTAMLAALHTQFPFSEIVSISNTNSSRGNCLHCEILDYQTADILIGIHGAGLTNVMFQPENAILFEITGHYDGRMMPLCGYHGSLASIFGVHHYLYYYDWRGEEVLNASDVAKEVYQFYQEVQSPHFSAQLKRLDAF